MTTLEILLAAQQRIRTPSLWCAYWSISQDGKRLDAAGAIAEVELGPGPYLDGVPYSEALHLLAEETNVNAQWTDYDRVSWWNGSSTHKDIMAGFERAITKLKEVKDG